MKKLIFIIILFIATPLMAENLTLWRIDETKFSGKDKIERKRKRKRFRQDSKDFLRNKTKWRHPAELWNPIKEENADYYYAVCSPKIMRSSIFAGKVSKGAVKKVVDIPYNRYGYMGDTVEWDIYKSTIAKYRSDYESVISTDTETSTDTYKGE